MLRNDLFERCRTIKNMTSTLIRSGFSLLASYLASILEGGGILHLTNNKGAIQFYRKGLSVCGTTGIFFLGGGRRMGPKKIGDWLSQTPSW